ncbi:probable protein phosphatase 2C 75 isoform X2 [Lactuca sativa]|uniref:probable protein phosphatase 2C 75 isoform X2 n=1 Tax=Lactuca sativa TaxID=4236 RepID=UPI000CB3BC0E|nr:probable protein phosphatase 2C 75 isoform X2 [Lactuca sativa]
MKRVYCSCKSVMVSDEDEDSLDKCRERRQRRMAMRRLAAGAPGLSVIATEDITTEDERQKYCAAQTTTDIPTTSISAAAIMSLISIMETPPPPLHGIMSVVGRQREMEDEVSVRTNLCRPEINGFRPVHFFGVFDGHGGCHVSALCKEKMHVIMEEELMGMKVTGDKPDSSGGEELWKTAMKRSFQRIDEMSMRLCLCGGSSSICRCNPQLSFIGSTAVVSILTKEYIFVANCGDSRAVLCRNGRAIPLSVDHKPDREDERSRIESCGGRIMFADGARVEGILAMSRAIGDRPLKQWVTSEPEITVTRREAGDECLIVASDGLWDVISSELVCKIVHECLGEKQEPRIAGCSSESAATLLVRLALGRRSTDNISVIVIDLRN